MPPSQIILVLLAICTAASQAETIRLKTGRTLEGTILDINEQSVQIEWGHTKRSINKTDLAPATAETLQQAREALDRRAFLEAAELCTLYRLWHRENKQARQLQKQIHDAEMASLIESSHVGSSFRDSIVRMKAIATENDLPLLHDTLRNDPNYRGRRAAGWVLGHLRSDKSITPLIETITKDKQERVRRVATFALGEIGNKRASLKLMRTMMTDSGHMVRWWAAEALNKIGTRKALVAIKRAAAREKHVSGRDHIRLLAQNPNYRVDRKPEPVVGKTVEAYCKGTRYLVHVPKNYNPNRPPRLLVAVHGTYSWAGGYIKICKDDAEKEGVVLLAPHFEFGRFPMFGGLNVSRNSPVRADLRLLDMIEDLSTVLKFQKDRFLLFGHSEGGQFTHRFVLAHPDRILRAAACTCGWFVQPNPNVRFPFGLKQSPYAQDLKDLDFASLARSDLAIVTGTRDTPGHFDLVEQFMVDVNCVAFEANIPCNVRFLPSIGGHDGYVEFLQARKFLFADSLAAFDAYRQGPRTIERKHVFLLSRLARAKASSSWGRSYQADRINDADFSTRWNSGKGDVAGAWVELTWKTPVQFDRVAIDEYTEIGARIQVWKIEAGTDNLNEIARGTKMGRRYTAELPKLVTATRLRLTIEKAASTPTISELMPHKSFWKE